MVISVERRGKTMKNEKTTKKEENVEGFLYSYLEGLLKILLLNLLNFQFSHVNVFTG